MNHKRVILLSFLPLSLLLLTVGCSQTPVKKSDRKVDRQMLGAELEFGRRAAKYELWNEAIFRWEKVVKQDPENSEALNNLAIAYESSGNYDRALELYKAALEIDEDSREIRDNYRKFLSFYKRHKRHLDREKRRSDQKTTEENDNSAEKNENDNPEGGS